MRAFIAFSYQFNISTLLSEEKNVNQLFFRQLPSFLRCASEFHDEEFTDFLVLYESFFNNLLEFLPDLISTNHSYDEICFSLVSKYASY